MTSKIQMGSDQTSTDQWVPKYSNKSEQLICMNLHRFNGDPIRTCMPGWYWNTLELMCVQSADPNLSKKLVEIALRTAVEYDAEWNEAIKTIVYRFFEERRKVEKGITDT